MPHFPSVAGSEGLCGDDGKTSGKSDGETGDQEHEVSGGADGCQSGGTDIFAHDHGVYHVIQLLKDIPDEKGNGETDQQGRDGAPGHIKLHIGKLLWCIYGAADFFRCASIFPIRSSPQEF